MQPLLDGDILLHELGWSGEFKDKDTGEEILFTFDRVAELLDDKIKFICEDVGATKPPIIYISNSEWLVEQINKERKRLGEETKVFVPNFRYDYAKSTPYKGNRVNAKPFHFYNIIAYLRANYEVVISHDGLEADDMMCIEQVNRPNDTIICSRDKDLRICPGWHFSWECGKQKAIGPVETDRIGWLEKREDGSILGYGLKFFYFQMLVGDTSDTIPGLKGAGKAFAFKLLDPLKTEKELFNAVKQAYKDKMGEASKEYFLEQASLLWIRQQKDQGYVIPNFT